MGRRLLFDPTDADKAVIKSLYQEGYSCKMLAQQYKVSESQMAHCIRQMGIMREHHESIRLAIKQGRLGSYRAGSTRFNGWSTGC